MLHNNLHQNHSFRSRKMTLKMYQDVKISRVANTYTFAFLNFVTAMEI